MCFFPVLFASLAVASWTVLPSARLLDASTSEYSLNSVAPEAVGGLVWSSPLNTVGTLNITFKHWASGTADGMACWVADSTLWLGTTLGTWGAGLGMRDVPGLYAGAAWDEYGWFTTGQDNAGDFLGITNTTSTASVPLSADSLTTATYREAFATFTFSSAACQGNPEAVSGILLNGLQRVSLCLLSPLPVALRLAVTGSCGGATAQHRVRNLALHVACPPNYVVADTGCTLCEDIEDMAVCSSYPACKVCGSQCIAQGPCPACNSIADEQNCLRNSSCDWCGHFCREADTCPLCPEYTRQHECLLTVSNCSWCGSFCTGTGECPCNSSSDATACPLLGVGCDWCGAECRPRGSCPTCSALTKEATCSISTAGCEWCGLDCKLGGTCCGDSVCYSGVETSSTCPLDCKYCGGPHTITSYSGIITDGSTGLYSKNMDCHWDFPVSLCPGAGAVLITFEYLDSGSYDIVSLLSNGAVVDSFSGYWDTPPGVYSLLLDASIAWVSDGWENREGFQIRYEVHCNCTGSQDPGTCAPLKDTLGCRWCGFDCQEVGSCPPCELVNVTGCNTTMSDCSWCGYCTPKEPTCPECMALANQSLCQISTQGCEWCGPYCHNKNACPSCSLISSPTECSQTPNCTWCGAVCRDLGACPTCANISDPTECSLSLNSCSWCGTDCMAADTCPSCQNILTPTQCSGATIGCDWCGSNCQGKGQCPACTTFSGESECLASPNNCAWCGFCTSSGPCPKCSNLSTNEYNCEHAGCHWCYDANEVCGANTRCCQESTSWIHSITCCPVGYMNCGTECCPANPRGCCSSGILGEKEVCCSTSPKKGLSGGAIAGIVITILVLLCCCGGGGTYMVWFRQTQTTHISSKGITTQTTTEMGVIPH